MAASITRLYDLAVDILAAVGAHWPGGAEPLPDRQLVSNGSVIWEIGEECSEVLATAIERTYTAEADVALEQLTAMPTLVAQRAATVLVVLLRCVPDMDDQGNPPTIEEIDASAQLILTDAQSMFNAVLAGQQAGEIAGCQGLAFDSWTAQGPDGGMGGGTLRLRVFLQ